MKKVINGKMYNEETATKLGKNYSSVGPNDFNYFYEELYVTKKGNYFLAGEGGAMSQYARHHGNTSSGGSDIIPLTKQEAFQWAEDSLEPDEVFELFPDMVKEA